MDLRKRVLVLSLLAAAGCTDREAPLPLAPDTARFAQLASDPVVNSLADPGTGGCDATECTLREAIAFADTGATITFAPAVTGTIALASASGHIVIDRALSIVGPGAGQLAVRGNRPARLPARIFLVRSAGAEVRMSGLTVEQGYVGGPGGCIQSEGSRLGLSLVVVQDCEAFGAGGGVASTGTASHPGHLTLSEVTVRSSWAANGGGGVYNDHSSQLAVSASTISENEGREGGGLGSTGPATIVNSTVSGNRARAQGGGVFHQNAEMTIAHGTIAFNTSDGDSGGVFFYGDRGTLDLTHTIVASNTNRSGAGPDCASSAGRLPVTSSGYNLIGDATGCAGFAVVTGDLTGQDPLLAALADNGGPTRTHALASGSPALNAGDPGYAGPLAYDQRGAGFPRVAGGRIDVGAFEAFAFAFEGFFAPIANLPSLNSVRAGQAVPVQFSLGGDQGLSIVAAGYPKSEAIACEGSAEVNGVESTLTAGSSSLGYDAATDTYTYVWKTAKSWAGTCRQLTVKLTDGTEHRANFRFN